MLSSFRSLSMGSLESSKQHDSHRVSVCLEQKEKHLYVMYSMMYCWSLHPGFGSNKKGHV